MILCKSYFVNGGIDFFLDFFKKRLKFLGFVKIQNFIIGG